MPSIYDQIWSAALKAIELRPHSKIELKQKLKGKFLHETDLIDQVMEEMERVHLLNDQLFTEQYVAHLTQKNVGRMKIFFETKKKGLRQDMVEQALLNLDWSETDSAKQAIKEKERHLSALDERKKKEKLLGFLRNRGFGDRVIYSLLRE